MRHFYLIAAWMLLAATFTSGQTNVVTITSSGAVNASGIVTGNGVNSSGSSAGQLALTQGIAPANLVSSSFNLAAPLLITNAFQAVVPSAAANGLWRGTQAITATATASTGTVNGVANAVSGLTITSGSGYSPGAQACTISGGNGLASCSGTANSSGNVVSITVSGGLTYSAGAAISFSAPGGSGTTATGVLLTTGTGGSAMTATQTSGSGYATAPACVITGSPGAGATCTATITTSGQVNGLTVVSAGGGYTSGASVSFSSQLAMAFSELTGDATTNGSNVVTGLGMYGSGAASTADQVLVTTVVQLSFQAGAIRGEAIILFLDCDHFSTSRSLIYSQRRWYRTRETGIEATSGSPQANTVVTTSFPATMPPFGTVRTSESRKRGANLAGSRRFRAYANQIQPARRHA